MSVLAKVNHSKLLLLLQQQQNRSLLLASVRSVAGVNGGKWFSSGGGAPGPATTSETTKISTLNASGVSEGPAKTILRPPRAVTTEEAPSVQPAMESAKTTMMPWRGWFSRWLKEKIGEEKYEKIRDYTLFEPDAIYDLEQAPKPSEKIPISKTDPNITHMYRYPSPGSHQGEIRQPMFPVDEDDPGVKDPFDSGYFKRDTRRRYEYSEGRDAAIEAKKLELMGDVENDPDLKEEMAKLEAGPESSPGNKGNFATGPSDFDTTGGLRATMSVSWEAMEKELDANMPDHLPTPVWASREQEVVQEREERNLPPPVGEFYKDLKLEPEYRVARW